MLLRPFPRAFAALALATIVAPVLSAQSVRGRVVEITGNRGVPEATVILFSDSITAVTSTKTDSAGNFLVKAPKVGSYNIRVRKVGYMGGETGTMDLALPEEYSITIKTPRVAPVLSGVRVTAQNTRGYEWLQGFEERKRAGLGTFIEQQAINDKNSTSVGELLRGVPGVGVAPGPNGWYLITSTRGGRSIENNACLMDVYMDGVPMDQEAIQQSTRPVDLEAIEVYNGPATVPSQFKKQMTGSCGVVLLWTRVRNVRRNDKDPKKP
jgi:hypothetical protein